MDYPDPWADLNSRYEHDSEAQFLLFVEQFQEAKSLLESGVLSKLRMALVAADNLAELLLHRHKQLVRSLGAESTDLDVPRLDRSDLRDLERGFGARTRLGRKGGVGGMAASLLEPLLDELDEAIFRVAHAYRNRVYHADHHNPAVLPLLTSAYLGAVGRSFVRHQTKNWGHSISGSVSAKMRSFGYEPDQDVMGGGPIFWPAQAAEAMMLKLSEGLDLDLSDARETLIADLSARADWADSMVDDLHFQGMPEDRLDWALRWGEFWESAGVDPEVVRIERELAVLRTARLQDGESNFGTRDQLLEDRNARIVELLEGFESKLDLGEIESVRRLGRRLSSAQNLGSLFNRYLKLDERMDYVERHLWDTAMGWDREIQRRVDESRGK